MMVEKVPDSTYDMIGGAEQQIKEIKEVSYLSRMKGVAISAHYSDFYRSSQE